MKSSNIATVLIVSVVVVGLLLAVGQSQAAGLRRTERAGQTRILDGNQEIELQPGDTLVRNSDGSYIRQRQDADTVQSSTTNPPPNQGTQPTTKPKSGASPLMATAMLVPQLVAAVSFPLLASYWMRAK